MDEALIKLLLDREEAGLDQLQARYGGMLHYIADGILRDARDTEECVSDICLRVWDRIGQYDPQKGSFSAWLTALARNARPQLPPGPRPGRRGPHRPGASRRDTGGGAAAPGTGRPALSCPAPPVRNGAGPPSTESTTTANPPPRWPPRWA